MWSGRSSRRVTMWAIVIMYIVLMVGGAVGMSWFTTIPDLGIEALVFHKIPCSSARHADILWRNANPQHMSHIMRTLTFKLNESVILLIRRCETRRKAKISATRPRRNARLPKSPLRYLHRVTLLGADSNTYVQVWWWYSVIQFDAV